MQLSARSQGVTCASTGIAGTWDKRDQHFEDDPTIVYAREFSDTELEMSSNEDCGETQPQPLTRAPDQNDFECSICARLLYMPVTTVCGT